jgi:hypothetical protein
MSQFKGRYSKGPDVRFRVVLMTLDDLRGHPARLRVNKGIRVAPKAGGLIKRTVPTNDLRLPNFGRGRALG